jgi:hypothetical protein
MSRILLSQSSEQHAAHQEAARLEQEADRLLQTLPRDPNCPTYTEAQMERRRHTHRVVRLERLVETDEVSRPPQSLLDELAFLASVTPLKRRERVCLRGWLLGWTQREIGAHWRKLLPDDARQNISRLLRSALRKCYRTDGLTFTQFSRHTIYRRPARHRLWRSAICPHCGETFAWGLGAGRYCSTACREQHRR